MNTYLINGVVNVSMYNTILAPENALDDNACSESRREALWDRFDVGAYITIVCERAVVELRKLVERLPPELACRYVEDSAYIFSPKFYNYGGDLLWFKIEADSTMTEKEMQAYLTDFFAAEWDAEFGPDYQIYAFIAENHTLEEFQKDAEGTKIDET